MVRLGAVVAGAAAVHPRAAGSPQPDAAGVRHPCRQRARRAARGLGVRALAASGFVDGGARRVLRVLRPHLRGLRGDHLVGLVDARSAGGHPADSAEGATLRDDREEGDDALH